MISVCCSRECSHTKDEACPACVFRGELVLGCFLEILRLFLVSPSDEDVVGKETEGCESVDAVV